MKNTPIIIRQNSQQSVKCCETNDTVNQSFGKSFYVWDFYWMWGKQNGIALCCAIRSSESHINFPNKLSEILTNSCCHFLICEGWRFYEKHIFPGSSTNKMFQVNLISLSSLQQYSIASSKELTVTVVILSLLNTFWVCKWNYVKMKLLGYNIEVPHWQVCTSQLTGNVSYSAHSYYIRDLYHSHPCLQRFISYLLTYSMVQSPSWEANWFEASQEIPRISRNPKVHYHTHKRPLPVSILGQPNPVHIPTSHLLEIHPNTHPSTPRSPQWSPSLRFPHQDPIHPPVFYLSDFNHEWNVSTEVTFYIQGCW